MFRLSLERMIKTFSIFEGIQFNQTSEIMTMKFYPLLILFLLFSACSSEESADTAAVQYPNEHLLLSSAELNNMMQSEDLIVIDARSNPGQEFIPGAVHFAAVSNLVDPDHPIDNYLVGPDRFEEMMQDIGLDNDHQATIYDDGNSLHAARLFYALEYYGFSNAAILNGGIQGWKAENKPLEETPEERPDGNFTASVQESRFCDFNYVSNAAEDPDKIIFDVRSEGEYTGEIKRAEKNGHIPNAANLEWSNVIEKEGTPYFLPADEIQQMYNNMGITRDKEIIPHCQTNVRGSHAYFTLRLMGYDSVRPYEGSWAEYGNREDSVVE
jgi:thiosulfate/3-mercaptopyruvate sulfurtransferase